ncbi:response regulator receiver modulated CheW protein [Thioalkalivibrio sp. K90mix]|uniref:chemotaxis protein n=1 Tax=Thioalkalivibrio sp. (strain K90mix) TaxID=396595 RepID=UPI000195AA34|nr:chemotaxis protein [Thioalkalivibrio sp. K90mix]ADC71439.1 response regulator receiver modulated CheW protein [Thioalkalivibrio sp. K90mix]
MSQFIDDVNQRTQLVGQNRMELLLFHLGSSQTFGINVFKVREVIPSPPLRQIPGSMSVVRGVASLRGGTVPIIDLARAMGLRTAVGGTDDHKVVVTEFNRSVQGFWVSAVDRIVNVNWEDVKSPPRGTGRESFLVAVTEIDNKLVEIIDVERVLSIVNPLPINVSDSVRAEADEERERIGQRKIVIVDDSVVARKQIEGAIKGLGWEYLVFKDGREALDFLEEQAEAGTVNEVVELVISDIEMPRMDGYTLTARIRANDHLKGLRVLLHSSLSGEFNTDMVKRAGADAFLSKFNPDELAEAVLDQTRKD